MIKYSVTFWDPKEIQIHYQRLITCQQYSSHIFLHPNQIIVCETAFRRANYQFYQCLWAWVLDWLVVRKNMNLKQKSPICYTRHV